MSAVAVKPRKPKSSIRIKAKSIHEGKSVLPAFAILASSAISGPLVITCCVTTIKPKKKSVDHLTARTICFLRREGTYSTVTDLAKFRG